MRISDWSSDVCSSDIYRLMFSNGMSFGFPPKRYALDAYRTLLQSEVPGAPVMIAGLDVDVSELMADAVDAGIHISIGLEDRSEEHTSELQSLMRNSYAVFCLIKKNKNLYCTLT